MEKINFKLGAFVLKYIFPSAVSSMLFDCGGLIFPACAFSGWYMETGETN